MIYIKIELWPYGDKSMARTLGEMTIGNDGTGSPDKGNYHYKIYGKRNNPLAEGDLKNFPRRRRLAWDLLYRILYQVYGSRNTKGHPNY